MCEPEEWAEFGLGVQALKDMCSITSVEGIRRVCGYEQRRGGVGGCEVDEPLEQVYTELGRARFETELDVKEEIGKVRGDELKEVQCSKFDEEFTVGDGPGAWLGRSLEGSKETTPEGVVELLANPDGGKVLND